MKETRRMPSPDDVRRPVFHFNRSAMQKQLMTIQERLPAHFETCFHERQTASFGSFDNIELICFAPVARSSPNEMEKNRRHSGECQCPCFC